MKEELRELIDADLPPEEFDRLARVDTLLREAARPRLRLITTMPASPSETYDLKLTFRELALVYKSLQAAKTLGALPEENELLDDTIQLVDQVLNGALR
jgi:hypothetical protein